MAGKASYKKYTIVGPGGRKCSCCYPAPGKARRRCEKIWNVRERRQAMREIKVELMDSAA